VASYFRHCGDIGTFHIARVKSTFSDFREFIFHALG
jgi:hypothetical protein